MEEGFSGEQNLEEVWGGSQRDEEKAWPWPWPLGSQCAMFKGHCRGQGHHCARGQGWGHLTSKVLRVAFSQSFVPFGKASDFTQVRLGITAGF